MSAATNHHDPQALTDGEKMKCVKACVICYQTCQTCGYSSLLDSEMYKSGTINRLLDCAAICMASALLIARGSDLAPQAAELCIQACDRCLDVVSETGNTGWEECQSACFEASAQCREFVAASDQH